MWIGASRCYTRNLLAAIFLPNLLIRKHKQIGNYKNEKRYCMKNVPKYGVFSGPYFSVFGLNTEIYSINLLCIRTRKIPYLDTFHTVRLTTKTFERSKIRCDKSFRVALITTLKLESFFYILIVKKELEFRPHRVLVLALLLIFFFLLLLYLFFIYCWYNY